MARREEVGIDITARDLARQELARVGSGLRSIGDAAQGAERHASHFGSAFGSMAQGVFMGVGIAGLNAMTSSFGGLAGSIIGGAAEFERYETQFSVLLGSVDKAKQRMADLAAFGAKTPFELPGVVQADKVLTAFGIESQKQLTIVGDAAAGTGAQLDEMANIFGRISAGSYGEAFQRLAELGVATRKDLEGAGLKFDKGGSYIGSADQAMTAVNKLVTDKFGGMMEKQSQTLEGQWSNVQDMIGSALRGIGQELMPVFKGVVAGILDVGSRVGPALREGARLIGPLFADALATLGRVKDAVGPIITLFAEKLPSGIKTVSSALRPLIETILTPLRETFAHITSDSDSMRGVLVLLGGLVMAVVVPPFLAWAAATLAATWPIVAIVAGVAALLVVLDKLGILKQIGKLFDQLMVSVGPLADAIGKGLGDAIKSVVGFIQPLLDAFTGTSEGANKVGADISELGEIVGRIFSGIADVARFYLDLWRAEIAGALDFISSLWSLFGNDIVAYIKSAFAFIGDIFRAQLQIIQGVFDVFAGIFSGDWNKVWTGIQEIFGGIWDQIVAIFRFVITGAIPAVISIAGKAIGAAFDLQLTLVKTGIKVWWDGVTGFWRAALGGLGDLVTGAFTKIIGFITGLPAQIAGAASGMFDGIWQAFRSAVNAIVDGWNGLQFKIPGFSIGPIGYDGFTLGVPKIPHLDVGAWNLASDMIAMLHKGEMVVPSDFASGIRGDGGSIDGLVHGGGRGGDVYISMVMNFGPSSVRSREDIREIGRETTERARLLGFTLNPAG